MEQKNVFIVLIILFALLSYATVSSMVTHDNANAMKASVAGWGGRTVNIFRVGNCEYVEVINGTYQYAVTHKGDCSNPEHKRK